MGCIGSSEDQTKLEEQNKNMGNSKSKKEKEQAISKVNEQESEAEPTPEVEVEVEEKEIILTGKCKLCEGELDEQCIECEVLENPLQPCPAIKGGCEHAFHLHCMQQWLKKHYKCPMDVCKSKQWMFFSINNPNNESNETNDKTNKEEKEKDTEKEINNEQKDDENADDKDKDDDSDSDESEDEEARQKEREAFKTAKQNCQLCTNSLTNKCIWCQETNNNDKQCITCRGECGHEYHYHCISKNWLKSITIKNYIKKLKELDPMKYNNIDETGIEINGVCPVDNKPWFSKQDRYTTYLFIKYNENTKIDAFLKEFEQRLPNICEVTQYHELENNNDVTNKILEIHFVDKVPVFVFDNNDKFENNLVKAKEFKKNNEFFGKNTRLLIIGGKESKDKNIDYIVDFEDNDDSILQACEALKRQLLEWHPWMSERLNIFARRRY